MRGRRAAGVVTGGLLAGALLAGCTGTSGPPAAVGLPATGPTVPAVAALGLADCPSVPDPGRAVGDLPALQLPCSGQGPAVSVSGLADGTPTVLNFWASWCGPCARELPVLQQGYVAMQALPSAGGRIRLLGVQTSETDDSWPALLAETGVTYPSIRDDLKKLLPKLGGGASLPVTIVVRGDGTVAGRHFGAITDYAALRELIRKDLGVDLGAAG